MYIKYSASSLRLRSYFLRTSFVLPSYFLRISFAHPWPKRLHAAKTLRSPARVFFKGSGSAASDQLRRHPAAGSCLGNMSRPSNVLLLIRTSPIGLRSNPSLAEAAFAQVRPSHLDPVSGGRAGFLRSSFTHPIQLLRNSQAYRARYCLARRVRCCSF